MLGLGADGHGLLAFADAVDDARLRVVLCTRLVEVGHLQIGAVLESTARRLKLTEQDFQQRGLADAVRANQANAVAAHDT